MLICNSTKDKVVFLIKNIKVKLVSLGKNSGNFVI
jgi:hypothetical protein